MKFKISENQMHLNYSPDYSRWVLVRFKNNESITIKKTFYLSKRHVITPNNLEYINEEEDGNLDFLFVFATNKKNYWCIEKDILDTEHDVLIDKNVFSQKTIYAEINKDILPEIKSINKIFIADNNISIFKKIDALCKEQIIIGGNEQNAIPVEIFSLLIKKFPTTTEIKHYANSKITNILQEFFSSMIDGEEKLQKYFKHKKNRLSKISNKQESKKINIPNEFFESEIEKYSSIKRIIEERLSNDKDTSSEEDWQQLIAEILPLIFPQYVAILSKVSIAEKYSKEHNMRREIDFVLVNANGYIDILEIKKPLESCVLRTATYRDNYIPKKELVGTVMQVEKYIYYLNSLTIEHEKKLTKKYKDQLPNGLRIQIRNPKALMLLGRSNTFTSRQNNDFEFIKRKYANIIDMLTYDDLLERINNIIKSLRRKIN